MPRGNRREQGALKIIEISHHAAKRVAIVAFTSLHKLRQSFDPLSSRDILELWVAVWDGPLFGVLQCILAALQERVIPPLRNA